MAKKSAGLNMDEMKLALKKLAEFHASSAVYVESNGAFDEKYERGVYNSGMRGIFDSSFDSTFGYILENFFSRWPDLDTRIVDKMVSVL